MKGESIESRLKTAESSVSRKSTKNLSKNMPTKTITQDLLLESTQQVTVKNPNQK